MAAYRRVRDSRHLQADCQEPGSAPEPYARWSSMGYLYLYLLVFAYTVFTIRTNAMTQDANSELLPNQSRVLIFGSTATRSQRRRRRSIPPTPPASLVRYRRIVLLDAKGGMRIVPQSSSALQWTRGARVMSVVLIVSDASFDPQWWVTVQFWKSLFCRNEW